MKNIELTDEEYEKLQKLIAQANYYILNDCLWTFDWDSYEGKEEHSISDKFEVSHDGSL